MPSALPVLNLLQNVDGPNPIEREVDRSILIDVAPDREEFLTGATSIDEIRRVIKLRVLNPSPGHWLNYVQRQENARLSKNATASWSVFDEPSGPGPNLQNSIYVVERVPNAPSSSSSTDRGHSDDQTSYDISSKLILLNQADVLVSPRELGATHMLVVHALPSKVSANTLSRGRRRPPSVHAEVLELPINDLIFIANVPNLCYDMKEGCYIPILPRRLPKALPRVLLPVPDLNTFPALILYLHTQNQAALFRALIPDWARDVMYPLPQPPRPAVDCEDFAPYSQCCVPIGPGPHNVKISFDLAMCTSTSPTFKVTIPRARLGRVRTVDSVGAEVAEASASIENTDSPDEAVRAIVMSLDGFRDNLEYIGYFKNDLWVELTAYRRILLSALSHQARVRT
ncbi:hypothetical protein BJ912DRAFT_930275 [Pholiota molesta]|nr:hypothetical protein BJ912DRAFT_930275 [Pholiota molesta]